MAGLKIRVRKVNPGTINAFDFDQSSYDIYVSMADGSVLKADLETKRRVFCEDFEESDGDPKVYQAKILLRLLSFPVLANVDGEMFVFLRDEMVIGRHPDPGRTYVFNGAVMFIAGWKPEHGELMSDEPDTPDLMKWLAREIQDPKTFSERITRELTVLEVMET